MNTPKVTAKDFFLWLGAMVTFYWSVVAFVSLMFSYINYAFRDTVGYYGSYPVTSVSYEMASLIVMVPVFLLIMRIIRRDMAADPSRSEIWVRRWALVLTLFAAGAALAGDLITLLMYFFNGDATLAFFLKVLLVFLVAGGVFLHFFADLRGYYVANPGRARMLSIGIGILILASIIAGFFILGTPWQARDYRYDEQKVGDLQNIQWQIVSYWQQKQELPAVLTDLGDPISGYFVPADPQTGEPYEYRAIGAQTFELCATFNADVQTPVNGRAPSYAYPPFEKGGAMQDNWQHGPGRTCFERTIDPERYPPLPR